MTIPQSFALAVQYHQAGKLAEAESLYRQILAHDPQHADALNLLGALALQSGQPRVAADLINRAIALRPREASYHNNLGNVWMSLGDLAAATAAFRTALTLRRPYPEAHFNLGLTLQNQGLVPEAVSEYRAALAFKPDYTDAWHHLGIASVAQGRLADAEAAFREALRFRPLDARIHYDLGNALLDQARSAEAAFAYREALRLYPDYAEAHYNLGIALHNDGHVAAAKSAYLAALSIKPDYPAAQGNLGKALLDAGQVDEAIAAFQATLRLVPTHAETHHNLGNAWRRQDQPELAARSYRAAGQCDPRFVPAWINLGNLLQESDQLDEAITAYHHVLAIKARNADALNNLAGALKSQGRIHDAVAASRQAVALQPDNAEAHGNLIYHLHFDPRSDPRAIRAELASWNERHIQPLHELIRPNTNLPDPSRRLKIGYVSGDLRDHVIGRNLLPFFQQHDHTRFEITCYASSRKADRITRQFQACADQWRDTFRIPDEDLAAQIRQDGIDILVDLTLHLAHNRLLVFARQPAPVQVTFAGYPGSTGVETIRYRLTDPWLDPPRQNDAFYSEESIRLPHSFWCFAPLEESPEVNDLPARREDRVTFGCLNNFAKTNEDLLALWARVLVAVADSRMLLLAPSGKRRPEILEFFHARGVDAHRVEFLTKSSRREYLQWHHRIDLMLDTFPYNGHTTSLDALWMGVPVVTLAGEHAVSRAGFSQLSNLHLRELVASSPDEYMRLAGELAHDLARLADLRASLRPRLQASPLMDAPRFARDLEAAYRHLWERWCEERGS